MALNPLYVVLNYLQEYFVDKQTGLPLSGGKVYFWHDNNRNSLKPVYQLTSSPTYSYTALPNPMTLSNAGTFVDNSGNDISVYAYPYDAAGEPDNYYIQVFAAGEAPPPIGTPMLTREAVPGVVSATGPGQTGQSGLQNALANSQFGEVLFDPDLGMTISYTAGTQTIEVAPGWFIEIIATSGGSLNIAQNTLPGTANAVTNPPYSLTITPTGLNISSLILYQRFEGNPGIFANGFISGGFALAPGSPLTFLYYEDSIGVRTQIVNNSNTSGAWEYTSGTVPLGISTNPGTAPSAYVDIQIVLNTALPTTISSIQVIGMAENIPNIPYTETPLNEQKSDLFYYWQPKLEAKPIPSYLIGWDFPMNPAQFAGTAVGPIATGNNGSFYAWDQTIVFQSIDSAITVDRAANGAIVLTATGAASQVAIIQYLEQAQARELLNGRCCVKLKGQTSDIAQRGTISLWAKTGALPIVDSPTYQSIVATLGVNGAVATQNGTWSQLSRDSLGAAEFSLLQISTELSFSGWTDNVASPLADTAEYFAIVIGFDEVALGESIQINWIGLNSGDIPTQPAPKSASETLLDCQRYYWKTFENSAVPVTAIGINTGEIEWTAQAATVNSSVTVEFGTIMSRIPTMTLYNPVNANAFAFNGAPINLDCTATAASNITTKRFTINATSPAGAAAGSVNHLHATANARLGTV